MELVLGEGFGLFGGTRMGRMTLAGNKKILVGLTGNTIGLVLAWPLAMAAILVPEHFLGIRLVAWGFVAYRIWKQPLEGLLLLAFFTPLFDNFGVIPIDFSLRPIGIPTSTSHDQLSSVFFSIKPVQLITLLLIGSLAIRRRLFFKDPLDWLVVASLIGMLGISVLAGAYSDDPLKAFRVSFNFAIIIALCKVLMSMLDRRELFWKILWCYFGGVVFLCLVHTVNYFSTLSLFGLEIVHFNNHFGFLLSMSFPLELFLLCTASNLPSRLGYLGLLLFSFFCMALTLSRAALYSTAIGTVLFLILVYARSPANRRSKILGLALGAFSALAVPALLYEFVVGRNKTLSLFSGRSKLSSFTKLFDPSYWRHSIFLDPNGGMFGERFVQLGMVKKLFLQHWLFGEGWTNRVISFHGLAYTMLTGTGAVGFSLFAFFMYWTFRALWRISKRDPNPSSSILALALFCSLTVWMLHCLLETYFLQFHIWLILAMILAYIKLIRGSGEALQAHVAERS